MALACALALAGCNDKGATNVSAAQPRGATIAFESIDGPPRAQFQTLVRELNDEAQSRRLAVLSRSETAAYRVRGYLAASVAKERTTFAWVWDVFDSQERRALRISGEEAVKTLRGDAWAAADAAVLRRIANKGMSQLAAFLTSQEVAPGTPAPEPTRVAAAPEPSTENPGATPRPEQRPQRHAERADEFHVATAGH